MLEKNRSVHGARALASRGALLLAALLVAITVAEVGLRLSLNYLPYSLADALATSYVDFGNGIYRFDPALNMLRMRPHYHREMFFNGYYWHHQSDWMGFRNPQDRHHVDIALIGDSMVYGHGIEEPSTVASYLERLVGRPVGNLGIQGGAMDYEYEILRHDAVRLTPQWVFIFFLNNDLTDLGRLKDDELQRFIDLPLDDHTTRYFHYRPTWHRRSSNFDWRELYVVRGYLFFAHQIDDFRRQRRAARLASAPRTRPSVASAAATPATPPVPAWVNEAPFAGSPRMQLAMRFHLRAIAKSDDFARRHNMHFAYIFFAVPAPFDTTFESIITDYCHAHNIPFYSLRPVYDQALRAGLQIYLPHDGHLSDAGAKLTAQALADHFPLRQP